MAFFILSICCHIKKKDIVAFTYSYEIVEMNGPIHFASLLYKCLKLDNEIGFIDEEVYGVMGD